MEIVATLWVNFVPSLGSVRTMRKARPESSNSSLSIIRTLMCASVAASGNVISPCKTYVVVVLRKRDSQVHQKTSRQNRKSTRKDFMLSSKKPCCTLSSPANFSSNQVFDFCIPSLNRFSLLLLALPQLLRNPSQQ